MADETPTDLGSIRDELDVVDQRLVRVLTDRASLISDVIAYKRAHGMAVVDRPREEAMLDKIGLIAAEGGLDPGSPARSSGRSSTPSPSWRSSTSVPTPPHDGPVMAPMFPTQLGGSYCPGPTDTGEPSAGTSDIDLIHRRLGGRSGYSPEFCPKGSRRRVRRSSYRATTRTRPLPALGPCLLNRLIESTGRRPLLSPTAPAHRASCFPRPPTLSSLQAAGESPGIARGPRPRPSLRLLATLESHPPGPSPPPPALP